MPDQVASSSRDQDVTSMTPSQSNQPIWMSHWNNRSSKPGSTVDNSALICYKEGHLDLRGRVMQSELKKEDGLQYGKGGVGKGAGEINTENFNHNLIRKPRDFESKLSNISFPTISTVGKKQKGKAACTYNKPNASKPVVVFEKHFSNDNFTCFSQDHCKYQKSSSVLFNEKKKKMENNLCHDSGLSDGLQLQHRRSPRKENVQSFFFKKQSQNVQGQTLNKVPCSFHNVETMRISTMVDCMGKLPGDPPKVSQTSHHILFTKETCVNLCKGHQLIEEYPLGHREGNMFDESFSMPFNVASHSRGVKLQPLWSTDSEDKETTGNPSTCKAGSWNEASAETDGVQVEPTFSHQEEKQFGGFLSMSPIVVSHSRGVKIKPLWTSTDSEEKESIRNPSSCRADSKNEASSESGGMQVVAPENQHNLLGMESSPLTKDDAVDVNSLPAACDSSTEKARSKRPITEIPDINEEAPEIQPEVSSTDGKDPSTARVHSLNAKQLFSCQEQTSRSECNARQEPSLATDPSSRWIKRLKVGSSDSFGVGTKSSDMGESSSHEKFNTFNRIMKYNQVSSDAKLHKDHDKVQIAIDQNVESLRSGGSSSMGSKKRNQSMMRSCSWIQRWCQSCTAPPPSNPEPLVICEPHKLGQSAVAKKQFPSIAAMALMGKAMNGFRSCEFKKRGPVVVWNTKEY